MKKNRTKVTTVEELTSPRWNYCNFPGLVVGRVQWAIFYFLANHSSRNYSFNLSSGPRKKDPVLLLCAHERHSTRHPSSLRAPFPLFSFSKIFLSPRNALHQRFSRPPTRNRRSSSLSLSPPAPIGKLLPSVEPITNVITDSSKIPSYVKISFPLSSTTTTESCPWSQITEPILLSRWLSQETVGEKNRGIFPLPFVRKRAATNGVRAFESGERESRTRAEEKVPVRRKIVSIPGECNARSRGNGKSLNGEISFSRSNIWASPNEPRFLSAPFFRYTAFSTLPLFSARVRFINEHFTWMGVKGGREGERERERDSRWKMDEERRCVERKVEKRGKKGKEEGERESGCAL